MQKLMLDFPVFEYPQNIDLPHNYPGMNQATEWSRDFYELAFWGIDEWGDRMFLNKKSEPSKKRLLFNHAFKYALGLGFSKYGSELPIPLGVWAHEEFHRSALGVSGTASKNGNWIFHRWDGTVYGISDESLDLLKARDINQLLYSYVAGVQYEAYLNQRITVDDFYNNRSLYKNPLLLYNAYYVFNYFRFSTSSLSDSVKVIAPEFEDANPINRDYAGADLTAWTYDMFNPELPFTSRDSFPNGNGVNRRVGFSDLSAEAQDFLIKQRKLSLLNFLNPAVFFINRIKIGDNLSLNLFAQYVPTYFGNDVALYVPVKYNNYKLLFGLHNYNNYDEAAYGLTLAINDYEITEKINVDFCADIWKQPASFLDNSMQFGGALNTSLKYRFRSNFSGGINFSYKSKGWVIGNPYLSENISIGLGLNYKLVK
ncbi:hypothetical protein SDC9_51353 [bioreactor metagenome]|uniref:Uncharacterized protein n=1 Tax=bioreactor metagenome TaxID=1076179 RepID=A0A644WN62_9ZZZZ